MERGLRSSEEDRHTRAAALDEVGAECDKERFDIPPPDIGRYGIGEDCLKHLLLLTGHGSFNLLIM